MNKYGFNYLLNLYIVSFIIFHTSCSVDVLCTFDLYKKKDAWKRMDCQGEKMSACT